MKVLMLAVLAIVLAGCCEGPKDSYYGIVDEVGACGRSAYCTVRFKDGVIHQHVYGPIRGARMCKSRPSFQVGAEWRIE